MYKITNASTKLMTINHIDIYMTKQVDELFLCEECDLLYKEEELAQKCEDWCRENKSCNLEITKHAVNKSELALQS